MTTQRDFKRLVRQRMEKTGESYTAARRHFLTTSAPPTTPPTPPSRPATGHTPADYAALAGMRDAAVAEKTGCGWEKWVYVLDKAGAANWPHREIAAHVREKYRLGNWWAQSVTVGYERIKGRRAVGQRSDGEYAASRSRTFPTPVDRLYRACRNESTRKKWLGDVELTVRTATVGKSIRARTSDGTTVSFWFLPKGPSKSQVSIDIGPLPDRATADAAKREWGKRLDRLGATLAG